MWDRSTQRCKVIRTTNFPLSVLQIWAARVFCIPIKAFCPHQKKVKCFLTYYAELNICKSLVPASLCHFQQQPLEWWQGQLFITPSPKNTNSSRWMTWQYRTQVKLRVTKRWDLTFALIYRAAHSARECWFISMGRVFVLKWYKSQKVQLKELILIFWEGEREALQHLLPKCWQLSVEALHSEQHHCF